jgi:hypothetical protein
MKKIIFRNSDYRQYREKFYDIMNENYDITFVFRHNEFPKKFKGFGLDEKYNSFFRDKTFMFNFFKILTDDYDMFLTAIPKSMLSLIGILFSKIRRKRVLIWEENWFFESKKNLKNVIKFLLLKFIYFLSDRIYVTSTKTKKFLNKKYGVPINKMIIGLQASMDLKIYESASSQKKIVKNLSFSFTLVD